MIHAASIEAFPESVADPETTEPAARPASPIQMPPICPIPCSKAFLRLEAALTMPDFWRALGALVPDTIRGRSLALGLGMGPQGPAKLLKHGDPDLPVSFTGVLGRPAALRRLPPNPAGQALAILAWQHRKLQAALIIARGPHDPAFSPRELLLAATLQPHFQVGLHRVLGHEDRTLRSEQLSAILEYVPIGLLILDWDLKPCWFNNEAANCCANWNHGERRAQSVKARRTFRVPHAIISACIAMRARMEKATGSHHRPDRVAPVTVNATPALHARIAIHQANGSPFLRPVFRIHLDYRRPRGDREKEISENAIALLDRLSGREREVAMWLREGLRNAEIAAEMHVSPATIKAQLASIYAKLDVQGRSRAAALLNR